MSNQDPGTESQLDHDIAVPALRKPGTGRRYVATFAAAALAAVGVGGAVWAWQSFMGQGAQPAEALPANTLVYAALDLDPPGGQKVEAFKTLQRFPSIKRELGLGSVDDVQKSVVKELSSDGGCKLDYQAVKPWLGDRIAAAVVSQKKPEAVLVLQVSDQSKARAELTKTSSECDFGFAFSGDWAILARNNAVATQASHDAKSGTLSDHNDFKRLTSGAGGAGLVSLYAAPEAGKALLKVIDDDPFSGALALQLVNTALDPATSFITSFGLLAVAQPVFDDSEVGMASSTDQPQMTPAQKQKQAEIDAKFKNYDQLTKQQQKDLMAEQDQLFEEMYGPMDAQPSSSDDVGSQDAFPAPEVDPALRSSLEHFTGLGGVGRFADHGLEVEIAGDALNGTSSDMYAGSKGGDLTGKLPQDTAVAFGAGLASGWVDTLFKQYNSAYRFAGSSVDDAKKAFEKSTGLSVPGDVEALGGDGVSLVADAGVSFDAIYDNPTHAPIAARITGDPTKIEAALDKLREHRGKNATPILSRRVGDDVLVSTNATYLTKLAKSDGLGDADSYKQVLPDADGATTVLYLNFDAGDWLAKSVSGSDRADAKPLHALGISVAKSKGQQHVLLRLSFDD